MSTFNDYLFLNIILGIDGCIDQTFTGIFWKAFGDLIGRELKPHIDQRLPSKYQIQWIDNIEQDLPRYFSLLFFMKISFFNL
jgi:hypothetical protein